MEQRDLKPLPARPLVPSVERLAESRAAVNGYLLSLSESSRRTVCVELRSVVRFATRGEHAEIDMFPWYKLTVAHVEAIRAWLNSERSPATTNKVMSFVRGVVRSCWKHGLIDNEQYTRIAAVKGVRGSREARGRHLNRAEVKALMRATGPGLVGMRDKAMLVILLYGGLRRAEVNGLTVGQWSETQGGGGSLTLVGKGNRERTVYIPPGAAAHVHGWLQAYGAEPGWCAMIPRIRSQHGTMLPDPRIPISADGIHKRVNRLAERAGIGKVTPHDLRRTMVGTMLDAGVDLATVQAVAGHASPTTTARYDRRGERSKEDAALKMAGFLL